MTNRVGEREKDSKRERMVLGFMVARGQWWEIIGMVVGEK